MPRWLRDVSPTRISEVGLEQIAERSLFGINPSEQLPRRRSSQESLEETPDHARVETYPPQRIPHHRYPQKRLVQLLERNSQEVQPEDFTFSYFLESWHSRFWQDLYES